MEKDLAAFLSSAADEVDIGSESFAPKVREKRRILDSKSTIRLP